MNIDLGARILSDLVCHGKYAQRIPDLGRREVYAETVTRNRDMHLRRFPELASEIRDAYDLVADRKVLPSMRSMQFGGRGIEKINARMYNCSYTPVDHHAVFAEVMFLLLCGCGVGYSVQRHHVVHLPRITPPGSPMKYLVGDSIEGWADAVRRLMKAYLHGAPKPRFDFADIRPKGTSLSTGGLAPGPEPLALALAQAEEVLARKSPGEKLSPLDCHDIICHLSDAVLSGGIRRSAMISLFDADDHEMLTCKFPENFQYPSQGRPQGLNLQRARANNSAVLVRQGASRAGFMHLWKMAEESQAGEPGVFWTNDPEKNMGTNPCAEIALSPHSFCNLTELNAATVSGQADLLERAWAASFIGTLQAAYSDFHYLRPIWKAQTEQDALLGVSMTGIASGGVMDLDLGAAVEKVLRTNADLADRLGVARAARTTCVKPSGTASLVLGCSSGIHAWHDDFYVRRVRLGAEEPIAKFLCGQHPELIEPSVERPGSEVIVSVPVRAPRGSQTRQESPLDLLERVRRVSDEWIAPGHRRGLNRHNVSCTVNIKNGEWGDVAEWLWAHRESYSAMSCYPYYETSYVQPPFESISEREFQAKSATLRPVDFSQVSDGTMIVMEEEAACAGGACELTSLGPGAAASPHSVNLR
jgi:ribonucleoside-triphosphate reductase (thioredoxin)